jgi:hypothetical protein
VSWRGKGGGIFLSVMLDVSMIRVVTEGNSKGHEWSLGCLGLGQERFHVRIYLVCFWEVELTIYIIVPVYASMQDLDAIKGRMAKMKAELLSEVVTVGVLLSPFFCSPYDLTYTGINNAL